MNAILPLETEARERLLALPDYPARLLIDTDAANEIDDQFALAWALLSPEHMTVEAVTAEPYSFAHHRPELLEAERSIESGEAPQEQLVGGFQGWVQRLHARGRRAADVEFVGTAEGMERSYQEILRIHDRLGRNPSGQVFRGARAYMAAPDSPVDSEAVETIIRLARNREAPLYIAAMGCVTNIASAILRAPDIIDNSVVIWTSAYPSWSPSCNRPSLNLVQDLHASRLMFDSGVALVYLPGYHIGAQLRISRPEMELFVRGRGRIGDYLWQLYTNNPLHEMFAIDDVARRTWVIWDIIDIAWLISPDWVPTCLTTSPKLDRDLYWRKDPSRHLIREAHDIQRDEIFRDLYDKLARAVR